MKGQKKGTYNRMKKFTIGEISSVDQPAQGDGARMTIMKRAIEKKHALTDPMDGHSHILHGIDEATQGTTSYGGGSEDGFGHSHPWIIGLNGELIVGAEAGHTHRVGFFSKSDILDETHFTLEQLSASSEPPEPADGKEPMTEEEKAELEKANARADRAEKMATMNDVEKSFHAELKGDEADKFLNSNSRDAVMAKAAEADPVVATTDAGVEIRKSQDPTGMLATMVLEKAADKKKADEDKKKADEKLEEAKKSDLAKRAGELNQLPGDEATKVEILKAIDAIEDEGIRKSALESLAAKNAANDNAFAAVGTLGQPEDQSSDDELDSLAKAAQADDSSLSYEQAYDKVLNTPKGEAIYNKRLEA